MSFFPATAPRGISWFRPLLGRARARIRPTWAKLCAPQPVKPDLVKLERINPGPIKLVPINPGPQPRTNLWTGALALALIIISGCSQPPKRSVTPPEDPSATALRPFSDLPLDVMWRQQVTISWGDQSEEIPVVLQKNREALVLVGLGPLGPPSFVIRHDKDKLALDNRSGRDFPFSAAYIIADIQRAFFPWALDGQRPRARGSWRGLVIEEQWEGEELRERLFYLRDSPQRGAVRVRYMDGSAGLDVPTRVSLVNEWFGYRLEIETLEQGRL